AVRLTGSCGGRPSIKSVDVPELCVQSSSIAHRRTADEWRAKTWTMARPSDDLTFRGSRFEWESARKHGVFARYAEMTDRKITNRAALIHVLAPVLPNCDSPYNEIHTNV